MIEPFWPLGDLRWGLLAVGSFSLAWLSGRKTNPKVDKALTWGVIVSWIIAGTLVIGLVAVPALIEWLN